MLSLFYEIVIWLLSVSAHPEIGYYLSLATQNSLTYLTPPQLTCSLSQSGETVLLHAAGSSVGIAAVQLASSKGWVIVSGMGG